MALQGKNRRIRARMRRKFLEVYEDQRCNASATRKILGLGLHTFDKWMKRYPKFAAKIMAMEEALVEDVEGVLVENALGKKQRAIEFFLLNRKRQKYRNTQRSEVTGVDGGPVLYKEMVYEPVEKLPPLKEEAAIEEKKDD